MRYRNTLLALILIATSMAYADVDVENGRADSFTLSAYARVRLEQYGGALEIPDRSFSIESAGLTADFKIDNNLDGQLQIETTPEDIFVKDCYINWSPFDLIEVRAGRFKKPFCLNALLSRWDLQSIDHSIGKGELDDLLYSGRDIGTTVRVKPEQQWLPEVTLGLFNGSPDWLNQDNEPQYVARFLFRLPLDVDLGANLTSMRFGELDLSSASGYSVSARQIAFGGDLSFEADITKDVSLTARGELIRGDNWDMADVISGEDPPQFQTWWFTGGVTWNTDKPSLQSVTLSASMSSWQPDRTDDSREDELTFTMSLDTGTPVTLNAAMVNHKPRNMMFQEDRTDYILEAAMEL